MTLQINSKRGSGNMSQSRFNNQAANNTYEQQPNIRVEKGHSKDLLYNTNK